jgi:tetratricopeptide (TPR) repeat protein
MELEDDDRQTKQEMISYCRPHYQEDKQALKTIDEFENQSINENAKDAIWWYTQNSIIFRCINDALVSGNISRIYSYRYIIKLLCRQLKNLHKQSNLKGKLRLYRGQLLKLSQILLISKHINDLISFNGFLSTSLEEDIAKRFCFGRKKKDHEPVIFEIDIDMTNEQSIAFADISRISQYPEEEEILFSIGSVFRIESVRFDEIKQLYRIHLSLSQHEQLTVNQYIEQTFPREVNSSDQSVLFGKLLFDMGEYQFAIEYFKNRIDCLTDADNHYRATYLNNIGVCYNEIGKKDQALKHYNAASRIYAQTNDRQGLGACYHNVSH